MSIDTNILSLERVEEIIKKAPPEKQKQFLADLPRLLKFSVSDLTLLKLSEQSFDFWYNADDAAYDSL